MPRGRPVVNRLELNAEQTATLKAIANSQKCAKFCVCQVLEGGGRNLSPLFYDVG